MPKRTVETTTDSTRSSVIPAPTRPAISWRGRDIVPSMILDLWRDASKAKRRSRSRILTARQFRRAEASSLVRVNRKWARRFPEAAAVASLAMEQRVTLDQDMIAAVGAVEPEYESEPDGFRDKDREAAEERQAFLEEWRLRSVPFQVFYGKAVEDGEFALIQLPCDLDMEGSPDYFEYISDGAYDKLDDDEKQQYTKDEDDQRQRRVKRDGDGKRVPRARYADMLAEPETDAKRPPRERESAKEKRAKAAQEQHQKDIEQYILRKRLEASAIRVVSPLDCAPVFKQGKGRDRFELAALVTRVGYEPWDLLDAKEQYRWKNLGDRQLIPIAYDSDGNVVSDAETTDGKGRVYVYTAYLPVKDDEGCTRILICTTVGGAGTWDAYSGVEDDSQSVSVIDLKEEYGIEGDAGTLWPFVTYHGGLHSEDDDPDQYWRPYVHPFISRVKAIEALAGSIRSATVLNSFTGYFHAPDPRWAASDDGMEAILDTAGNLRRPRMPAAGEIEEASGVITPAQQAQVGQDAWRLLQVEMAALAEATAIDQIPNGSGGKSGYAMITAATLGQQAKRQIREGVLRAGVACGEAFLRICKGIHDQYGIAWPVRTVQERPVHGEEREGRAPLAFDPEWVADSQFSVAMTFPHEENLARQDLAAKMYAAGLGSFEDVQTERGKRDSESERLKIDRDRLLRLPAVDALRLQRVARKLQDTELELIAQMQADQLMGPTTPGVPGGVPSVAAQGGGMTPPSAPGLGQMAGAVRGGVQGAEMRGDAAAVNAESAITGGGGMPQMGAA